MTPPEKSPPPKSPELRPNQVPWGAPKPAAKVPAPVPAPVAPPPEKKLSANKVPWGAHKPAATAAPPLPPEPDSMVTHMPWAEPTRPPILPAPPPAAEPIVSAKKVPWSWRKKSKPAEPPAKKTPEATKPSESTWAMPKGAPAPDAQEEMEFVREARPADDNEPTAEQLVSFLSRLTSRRKETSIAASPMTPYKARPISFEATRWESFLMWARAYRLRLGIGGTLLGLLLCTAYLLRLVALNAAIDRDWRTVETALRDRYALVPSYMECIETYSDTERYTFAVAQKGLTAWRTARTDREIAAAAAQMERVLKLLTKVMIRYDQEVPLKDADQAESSAEFAKLEKQKEKSRRISGELVQNYNAMVERFNDKIAGTPGSWIAWVARLHEREPLFGGNRE